MHPSLSRRGFLAQTSAALSGLALGSLPAVSEPPDAFSFVLLGDLHFDKLEHHDMKWLQASKPDDVRQVQDYSALTRDIMPQLFGRVRAVVTEAAQSQQRKIPFVLQVGDLVEGLCGTEELATRQNTEALAFLKESRLNVPFVFTKGNHDITGDGAADAFKNVLQPFAAAQARAADPSAECSRANTSFRHANALFCCYDAYDNESLEWLEAALARRNEQHCFVMVHPPVVPYGARSTWYLFSRPNQKKQREKLLTLLARQNAIVLGGHIHKYNTLAREVPGVGRFSQIAVSSIIHEPRPAPKAILNADDYTPDQIKTEPNFSPATEAERRAVYTAEMPFVKSFQYADLPGYAVIDVESAKVSARVFAGTSDTSWRTITIS